MCLYKLSSYQLKCRLDSILFQQQLLEMDQLGGLEKEKSGSLQVCLSRGQHTIGSLGGKEVQCKLISSLAPVPGSLHSGSYHIRNVSALHKEQRPARGHRSVKFPLGEGLHM